MKRFSFVRILLAILLVSVCSTAGFLMYQVGSYFSHLDAYSGHISRQDRSSARDELKDLQYFYDQNRKLSSIKLSWIGEKYLFHNIACLHAAYYNLDRDYSKTVDELGDKEGFCVYFLRANARWRQAQEITANATTLPDNTPEQKAEKDKQMKIADNLAATLVRDDYESAVKANPSHAPSSWNFDLVSDPKARARGLMPKPATIKVRLGIPGPGMGGKTNPGPKGENGKGVGTKTKDMDTQEEGPGHPKGKPRKIG